MHAACALTCARGRADCLDGQAVQGTWHRGNRQRDTASPRGCLLSDIGWRAHPDYRGEQSLNIISNASFVGLDHASRAYLAAAVFYRHQGLREGDLSPVIRELFTDRLRIRAKVLGATMRVASLLSASIAGMLPKVGITKSETGLSLDLGKDLADLDGERLRKRANQLSKVIDVDVAVNAG